MGDFVRRFWAHPQGRGGAVTLALLIAWCMITRFVPIHPWWLGIVVGVVAGLIMGRIGRFVGEIRQAEIDAQDAEVAMRDAIQRLERGDL